MNVYDSRLIASILKKEGFQEVSSPKDADVIIVNTCCVREHAEKRALGRINVLSGLKKKNPDLIIVVAGCMAQKLKRIEGADITIGPSNYRLLPQLIRSAQKISCVDEKKEDYAGIYADQPWVSAFLPVMRGCDNYCTYCIVPYVRGRLISRPYKDILTEAKRLVDKGVKEITLLGQSINQYEYNGVNFAKLLEMVAKESGVKWLRFLTSHPKYFTRDIIEVMVKYRNIICEKIHLPVQSGSNRILKLMNRKYTIEEYLKLVEELRKAIPDLALTTDIIVGFPTETEKDFEETLNLVKEVRFDYAFMFKYSEREGTAAVKLEPKVPEEERLRRLQILIDLQNRITTEINKKMEGKEFEVLVDGRAKRGDFRGKTRQDKVCVIKDKVKIGDFVRVKVKEVKGWTPICDLTR